jgi:hypothetical protein
MQKAAILVSHAERLQEGLLAGQSLAEKGLDVHILLPDSTATPAETGDSDYDIVQGQDLRCYTNRPDVAGRLGFHHATLAQMAFMLKDADVVIPF